MKLLLLSLPLFALLFAELSFAQKFVLKGEYRSFTEAEDFTVNSISGILIVDKGNSSVIQLDSLMNVLNDLGGYGWGAEGLAQPTSVASTGLRTYVCDRNNSRVQVYSKDLLFLYGITNDALLSSGYSLKQPEAVTVSPLGDIFVVDSEENRVLKFNYNSELETVFGDFASGDFSLNHPTDITYCESMGMVAVLHNNGVTLFDEFGSGVKTLKNPNIIAIEYHKGYLIYTSERSIGMISLSDFQEITVELTTLPRGSFQKAIMVGNKLYLLTRNSLYLYENNSNR